METPGFRLLLHGLFNHQWIKEGWFLFPRQGVTVIQILKEGRIFDCMLRSHKFGKEA